VNTEQAQKLGRRLRSRREELGLSVRDLERLADVDNGTIVRIEQGAFAAPRPDKLSRIAEALRLPLADVFALAEYVVPDELPTFAPYLRAKYRALPASALAELERHFDDLSARHGIDPAGPAPGEDERVEPGRKRRKP
jgi:transcriptional regulator with XRE-family HTH domain